MGNTADEESPASWWEGERHVFETWGAVGEGEGERVYF